jgi:small subunit ribosomal protein S17
MARTLTGIVASDKADKTIVINVVTRRTHPLYKKQYTFNTKYMAHDEKNEAKAGDIVIISETKPLSKRKHYSLSRILERGGVKFEETDATADLPEEPQPEPVESQTKPKDKGDNPEEKVSRKRKL